MSLNYKMPKLKIKCVPKPKIRNLNDELDPTFGKTDIGGTQFGDVGYVYTFGGYDVAGTITITKITYYAAADGNVRVAVYDEVDGVAKNLIVESDSTAVTGSQWNDIDVPGTQTSAGTYWLAWQEEAYDVDTYYDTNAAFDAYQAAQTYGSFPDPFSGTKIGSVEFSIYATYTTLYDVNIIHEQRL